MNKEFIFPLWRLKWLICYIMYKNAILLLAVFFPVNLIDAAKCDTSDVAC